jgi:NTE family protein
MTLERLPHPVGYVLGGGGSRGAVQVGMLQALSEFDISPDLVTGTSVGALNGALLALDPVGASDRLSHLWSRITREQVFPGGWLSEIRTLERSKTHLFPNSGLASVIGQFLGRDLSFDDLALAFGAVTTNVTTGQAHLIREGALLPALLASAAIPAIYPAMDHDGLHLCDGGVVANVPMELAMEMGAKSLIVLDCDPGGCVLSPQDSIAEIVLATITLAMRAHAECEAARVAVQIPVVYLPCSTQQLLSPLDFSHTEELIEAAYDAVRPFLASLDITGAGLYGALKT